MWNSPTTALDGGSGQSHQATYTNSSGNYESVSGNITVNVVKASLALTLSANPSETQTRPGSVELTAALPADATGTLTFKVGADVISTVILPIKTVVFTPTGSANTYSFTVEYSGDSNYENKTSADLEYSFTKSNQAELDAVDGTVSFGSTLDLSSLVSGGSGVGSISFVITHGPGEISGTTLTSTGVGEVTITVIKAADYDYNAKSTTVKIMANSRVITLHVTPVAAQTYTGSAITPEPEIRDGSVLLTAGADFTYGYADNISAGTFASVNIIGMGNYEGSTGSMTFTIGGGDSRHHHRPCGQ